MKQFNDTLTRSLNRIDRSANEISAVADAARFLGLWDVANRLQSAANTIFIESEAIHDAQGESISRQFSLAQEQSATVLKTALSALKEEVSQ